MEGPACLCSPAAEPGPHEPLQPSAGNPGLLVSSSPSPSPSLRACATCASCRDRPCSRSASNYARRRFRSCPSFPHAEGAHSPATAHSQLTPLGAMHALLCPPPCLAGLLSWLLQSYLSFITALFEGSVEATGSARPGAPRTSSPAVGSFLAASSPAASSAAVAAAAAAAAAAVSGARAAGPAPRARLAALASSSSASPQGPSSASLRSSRSRPSSSSCSALSPDMVPVPAATPPSLGASGACLPPPQLSGRPTGSHSGTGAAGTSAGSSGAGGGGYGTSVGSSTFGSFRSELTSGASSTSSSCSSSPEKERPGGAPSSSEAPTEPTPAVPPPGEVSSVSTTGGAEAGGAGPPFRGPSGREERKQEGTGELGSGEQAQDAGGRSPSCRRGLGLSHVSAPDLRPAEDAWQLDTLCTSGAPRGEHAGAGEGDQEAVHAPLLQSQPSDSVQTGAGLGAHSGPTQGPWHWWAAPWAPGADPSGRAGGGAGLQDASLGGREQRWQGNGASSAIPALLASTSGRENYAERGRKAPSKVVAPAIAAPKVEAPAAGLGEGGGTGGAGHVPTWATGMDTWEEEECCPTCLEEYTSSNPQIDTECGHSFHLSCIYEWMERSPLCPVCMRTMAFKETL